jgi:hypothetical protein
MVRPDGFLSRGTFLFALSLRRWCWSVKSSSVFWMINGVESEKFLYGIIGVGIILRCAKYLANRSLWLDESFLALNLIKKNFFELTQSLDYYHYQAAPVAFLMIEKLSICLFGTSEYALRLFPLLSGIISLFLFSWVAKRLDKPKAVVIAIGLFAISGSLVYYSSEAKQYSIDVTTTLLLYLTAISFIRKKVPSILDISILAFSGAISMWLSFPAVFVLAVIGIIIVLCRLRDHNWQDLWRLSAAYSLWILSFAILYFISLRNINSNKALFEFWESGFMPFPPWSWSGIKWLANTIYQIFWIPGGLYFSGLSVLLFMVGCISIFQKKKAYFSIIVFPMIITLFASSFHKYPFSGRLVLFLVPTLIIGIAQGVDSITERMGRYKIFATTIILGLLIVASIPYHLRPLLRPCRSEEIKPVLTYISKHIRNTDVIYIYSPSQFAFYYYAERYKLNNSNYIVGTPAEGNVRNVLIDLEKLRGNKRVWALFSHSLNQCLSTHELGDENLDEEGFLVEYLDGIGFRVDSVKSPGAVGYLYDLTNGATYNE